MNAVVREAVAGALGYEIPEGDIQQALEVYATRETPALRNELKRLEQQFKDGRGVELADQIDRVRIALTARKAIAKLPDEYGDEDVCKESPNGQHKAAHQATAAKGYTDHEGGVVVDFVCRYCGRSGSSLVEFEDIDW